MSSSHTNHLLQSLVLPPLPYPLLISSPLLVLNVDAPSSSPCPPHSCLMGSRECQFGLREHHTTMAQMAVTWPDVCVCVPVCVLCVDVCTVCAQVSMCVCMCVHVCDCVQQVNRGVWVGGLARSDKTWDRLNHHGNIKRSETLAINDWLIRCMRVPNAHTFYWEYVHTGSVCTVGVCAHLCVQTGSEVQ